MGYAIRLATAVGVGLLALVAADGPVEARRVALVIGNSAYEHTRVLPNAANDARLIAELLRKIGFEVREARDLAYRPMREAIRAFGQTAQGVEMALVYYAGHGLEVAGENWLLPVSAVLQHERDLEYEAVSLSSILAAVKGARRLRLVILDACRNNPLGDRIELASGTKRSVPRGLARIEPSGDILVAYSAKHGTLSDDGPAGGNSPFAAALAANLATPSLDVRIMLGKVRDDVRKATGGRQEPFTYGSVGGEIIAIFPDGAPKIAPTPSPSVATKPSLATELAKPGPLPEIFLGKDDAPITIVEYSDMTCPACAYFRKTVLPQLKEKYINTGMARIVFREFPTNTPAMLASMMVRCTDVDKAWGLITELFSRQDDWRGATNFDELRNKLFPFGQQAGLTRQAFDTCIPTPTNNKIDLTATQEKLAKDIAAVHDRGHDTFGVDKTPTFFVNGERLSGITLEDFATAIAALNP